MKKRLPAKMLLVIVISLIVTLSICKEGICQEPISEFEPLISDITSYFKTISGNVQQSDNNQVVIDKGAIDGVKIGMRVSLFREDVGFIHPVTRENIGKVEKIIGLGEVTEVRQRDSVLKILSINQESLQNVRYKIRKNKVKALFLQKDINWYLGDTYYHTLKSKDRFELIDSRLDTFDIVKLSEEAKRESAEIIIIIDSEKDMNNLSLRQRVYWASDMVKLTEKKAIMSSGLVQSILNKQARFISADSNVLLSYQVSRQIQKIALADLDGDGIQEIILATRDSFAVYQLGTDLKLLWEFKTALSDDILWLDIVRLGDSKRDSVVLTFMKDREVKSIIYKIVDNKLLAGSEINSVFLRAIGDNLIGQDYSKREGFENKIFEYKVKDGRLVKGDQFPLPNDANLYDFSPIESPDGKKALLTINDKGILIVYSYRGIILWQSAEDFGGFSQTYKKLSNIELLDRGQWSIKDRLIPKAGGVLIPKRNPIFGPAKGLGNKSTDIILLWYNGITVEQNKIIENIDGDLLDYNISNDRLIVLLKPPMGIKTSNLLKAENPFVNTIKILNLKGFQN